MWLRRHRITNKKASNESRWICRASGWLEPIPDCSGARNRGVRARMIEV
jgi:hypothetical protein